MSVIVNLGYVLFQDALYCANILESSKKLTLINIDMKLHVFLCLKIYCRSVYHTDMCIYVCTVEYFLKNSLRSNSHTLKLTLF